MRNTFTPIERQEAKEIAAWRYEGPYALYDGDPEGFETLLEREYRVHAARDERGELVGFCSFGEDARVPGYEYADDALDVGLGMPPDLVGRGAGHRLHARGARVRRKHLLTALAPGDDRGLQSAGAAHVCRLGVSRGGRFLREGPEDEFVVLRLDERVP